MWSFNIKDILELVMLDIFNILNTRKIYIINKKTNLQLYLYTICIETMQTYLKKRLLIHELNKNKQKSITKIEV